MFKYQYIRLGKKELSFSLITYAKLDFQTWRKALKFVFASWSNDYIVESQKTKKPQYAMPCFTASSLWASREHECVQGPVRNLSGH